MPRLCFSPAPRPTRSRPRRFWTCSTHPSRPPWRSVPAAISPCRANPSDTPPIAELAQLMLRIAGMRINPKTTGLHNTTFNSSLGLRKIPEGTEVKIDLPANVRLTPGRWSPDATRFTFTNTAERGIELWLGDTTGKTRKIEGVRASTPSWAAVVADAAAWAPAPPRCSGCPTARHSSFRWSNPTAAPSPTSHWSPPGRTYRKASAAHRPRSPMRTCCRIRTTKISSSIYATSQLTLVDAATGKTPPIGKAGIVESARISPDGRYLLVTTIHRPFSYLHDARAFPKEIEIWDRSGKVIHNIASSPLEDRVPINGVITGPRSLRSEEHTSELQSLRHLVCRL